jgi:nitrite reductase (NADH) large subunit
MATNPLRPLPVADSVAPADTADPVVVIGAGPVGIQIAHELLKRDPLRAIVLYGDEPWEPYQRVQLSALLMGEIGWGAIENRLRLPSTHRVMQHHHCAVVAIDRARRCVRDEHGREQRYARLILATGSHPHVPAIPGMERSGVFTFRNLSDVQRLMARRVRSRHTVVLGGGLLGLEAARALARHSTTVTLLQHAPRLMNRQLDETAATILRRHVEALGIDVILDEGVREVTGNQSVKALRLLSGHHLECDTLVLATGIVPNTRLALEAGLSVGRGIRVDDRMATTDPDIFAVGECAEHRGQVFGLVAPGLEQAAVAAHNLSGGRAIYQGSAAATHLKVVGLPVFSIGETGDDENPAEHRVQTWGNADSSQYRKIILRNGHLVGAIGIGEWPEAAAVQEAVIHRRRLGPLVQWRFRQHGQLWSEAGQDGVVFWPATATVCNCATISRGRLTEAVASGCQSIECLVETTGAGRVCGSCRPLLAELVGSQAQPTIVPGRRTLLWASIASLLVLAAFYLPGGFRELGSAQGSLWPQRLWTDGFWRQVSGYTLLSLGLVALLLSLRKRWNRFVFGDFGFWRVMHVVLGLSMLGVLVLHTGLRLGNNFNFLLLASFFLLTKLGSLASAVVAVETRPTRASRRWKQWSTLAHIVLSWPLPALLGFHILSVYYF